jgi:hypothetical protein
MCAYFIYFACLYHHVLLSLWQTFGFMAVCVRMHTRMVMTEYVWCEWFSHCEFAVSCWSCTIVFTYSAVTMFMGGEGWPYACMYSSESGKSHCSKENGCRPQEYILGGGGDTLLIVHNLLKWILFTWFVFLIMNHGKQKSCHLKENIHAFCVFCSLLANLIGDIMPLFGNQLLVFWGHTWRGCFLNILKWPSVKEECCFQTFFFLILFPKVITCSTVSPPAVDHVRPGLICRYGGWSKGGR